MKLDSKILVAGSNGMVGRAIVRNLKKSGCFNIIEGTRDVVDFSDQQETNEFFERIKPEYVFVAAAKVGGIIKNKNFKGDFLYQNLQIQNNIIHYSMVKDVKKLLFLGSSCIYPKMCEQPIKEEYLMTGPLEPTNDAYAVAKIAGIKLCQSYREQYGFNAISLMPTNLYGPNDNFDLETSHVLPAMIAKYHWATTEGYTIDMGGPWWPDVKLWGDGSARREFLHVDDLAEACFICMKDYNDPEPINVGTGEDLTIKELAKIISNVVGFPGHTEWDTSKPNGTPRKVLNVDKIKSLGWETRISLDEGIRNTYEWYKRNA
jgi:GDP-L-fucose synthase